MNLPTEYEPALDPESNFNRSAMRDWYAAKAEGQAVHFDGPWSGAALDALEKVIADLDLPKYVGPTAGQLLQSIVDPLNGAGWMLVRREAQRIAKLEEKLRRVQRGYELALDQWNENRDHADALEAELRQAQQQLESRAEKLAEEWAHHAIEEEHERTLKIQTEYIDILEKAGAENEALRQRVAELEEKT